MARAHLRYTVKDINGNVIENALVNVYLQGTTTPVSDMYAAATGGSTIITLTSNSQGEVQAWFTTPKFVDLNVTDNGDTAHYPGSSEVLSGTAFTETVEVLTRPDQRTVFNVLDYGLTGDGSTDEYTAGAALMTTAAGREIFFPVGTYITSNQWIPASGTRIRLDPGAIIKFKSTVSGAKAIFNVDDVDDVVIEGGTLDGNKANNATPTGGLLGIKITGTSSHIRVRDLTIQNFPSNDAAGTNGGDALYIGDGGGGSSQPDDVRIDNVTTDANVRWGAALVGGTNIVIDGCTFKNATGTSTGGGIDLEPNNPSDTLQDVTISNSIIDSNKVFGITAHADVDRGLRVVNNLLVGNGSAGSHISLKIQCEGAVVTGNQVYFAQGSGVLAGAANLTVADNHIECTDRDGGVTTNARTGVTAYSCADLNFHGNTIVKSRTVGLDLDISSGSGNVKGVAVTDNTFVDCVSTGGTSYVLRTLTDATHTLSYSKIRGNVITDSRSAGNEADGTFSLDLETADVPTITVWENVVTGPASVFNSSEDLKWSQLVHSSGVINGIGANTPESAITAPISSTWERTNGGVGTSFYVKTSGTGNTGWTAMTGATAQTYSASNVTTDRTYDANATTVDELADILGTLIADLRAAGVVL